MSGSYYVNRTLKGAKPVEEPQVRTGSQSQNREGARYEFPAVVADPCDRVIE